ncbi:MAG: ChaN family lipoprotein [Candidatus Binatia bacterium]
MGTNRLVDRLAKAEIVLLGEQHDNVDHHRIQARLLQGLIAAGRRPAVAFEQIDITRQAAVDAVPGQGDAARRASALADAVDWQRSGWPPFDAYRPVFETALGSGLPIRAANLSRAELRLAMAHAGTVAQDEASDRFALHDEARASLAADIEESHCGYANERMVTAMIEAQRRRDETMAGVVVEALGLTDSDGVVLIAGAGHARKDYGVPVYLQHRAASRRVVSVAMLEVIADFESPNDYAQAFHSSSLPFDFVIFTPRAADDDPCEKFREGLEKMKAR